MKESILYWKKLIKIWCMVEGHYGLTIPNIIGSVRLNTSLKKYNIEDFFNEILELNEVLRIYYCGDLEELVIGPFKYSDGPKSYYDNINSIYFTKNNFDSKITNYIELVEYFSNKYSTNIDKGLYSKDYYNKEWTTTTNEDKLLYNRIKNSDK